MEALRATASAFPNDAKAVCRSVLCFALITVSIVGTWNEQCDANRTRLCNRMMMRLKVTLMMPRPTALFFVIATCSFIALCVSTAVLLLSYRHHRPAYSARVFEEYRPSFRAAAAAANNNEEEVSNNPDKTSSSSSIQQEYVDYTIHRRQLTVDVEPRIIISGDDHHQHSSSTRQLGPVINRVLSYFKYRLDIDERRMAPQCTNHSSSSFFLLMIYVSAPDNFQQRQLIRQSWVDHRRRTSSSRSRRQHQMIFVIGRSQSLMTEWRLANESVVYGDVVQVSNVIDSYANLTLKSVALLHWALTRCPGAQFVVKSDDDNYVNVELLLSRQTLTSFASSSAAIYGTTNAVLWPARDLGHRHYVSREVWPWPRYPSYLMGGAYLISGGSSTLRRLLAAVQTTPFFPLEDAYIIGLCAPRVDIAIRYTSR